MEMSSADILAEEVNKHIQQSQARVRIEVLSKG